MKKFTFFCLILIVPIFLCCAHRTKPGTYEPKHIFEEEKDNNDYIMLTDEDVNISKDSDTASKESEASNTPSP